VFLILMVWVLGWMKELESHWVFDWVFRWVFVFLCWMEFELVFENGTVSRTIDPKKKTRHQSTPDHLKLFVMFEIH